MDALIIGAGHMGRGIATRFVAGGHAVTLYDVDRGAAEKLAGDLGGGATRGARVTVADAPADGIARSDVVVLASWYGANLDLARKLAAGLDGKVVIDISNPLNATYDGLVTPPGTSAAETIRAALPPGARVVKAFNTTFAGTLLTGRVAGQPLDVFIAGDDQDAKDVVARLVRDGGMNPIDAGALARARELEGLAFLGMTLQARLNTNFMTGWKLLMPERQAARA